MNINDRRCIDQRNIDIGVYFLKIMFFGKYWGGCTEVFKTENRKISNAKINIRRTT